jgi:D-amino peptidase
MRAMLWCDMEGVACIEDWGQVNGGGGLYEQGRALFTEEVNAAVRGCKRAGVDEIIVQDCHGAGGVFSFRSLIPERLEPGAQYVFGHAWARYVAPFERGVDANLFVAAHARAGTPNGVLSHTISTEAWYEATINGQPVGESGILAAVAGSWDSPGVFVSGDEATVKEVTDLLGPKVVGATVKWGLGHYSARNLTPVEARQLIEEQVYRCMTARDFPPPYKPDPPVTFRVELATIDQATAYSGRNGVKLVGPRTVESTGETFWEAWDQFWYRSG